MSSVEVLRTVARRLRGVAPAWLGEDDLVQEARIALWRAGPTAYARRVARHAMVDAVRRATSRGRRPSELTTPTAEVDRPDWSAEPVAVLAAREAVRALFARVRTPLQRAALQGALAGAAQADTAREHAVTPSAVSAALATLRRESHA